MRTLLSLAFAMLVGLAAPLASVNAAGPTVTLDGSPASLSLATRYACYVDAPDRLDCFRDPASRTLSPLAATVTYVGVLYENSGYGGASLSFAGSLPNLGVYGWNDRASSLKVYAGHSVTFYVDANYAGSNLPVPGTSYSSLGTFDNAFSSLYVAY